MLTDKQDALGHLLWDRLEGKAVDEILERDDGLIQVGGGPRVYFSEYKDWRLCDKRAVRFARGRVLDIGCGAGRHALYLQERGFKVTGIDESPLAVEVCKRRGLTDVRVCPIARLDGNLGLFDTILLLGNNFGLLSSRARAIQLLRRFARLTTDGGRIVAQSLDPYLRADPAHLAYHRRNRRKGRMAGQGRLRVRYRTYCTPWFDYLLVSPAEMENILAETPWRIARILPDTDSPLYAAVLEKRPK